jgi:di-N-acetylchitobiase
VISDPVLRAAWVRRQLVKARGVGGAGVNFDLESPIPPGAPEGGDYSALVAEAAAAFRAAAPNATVTVDVPWSPYDVDGRNYDWAGLAGAADYLFVMAYDIQSQVG